MAHGGIPTRSVATRCRPPLVCGGRRARRFELHARRNRSGQPYALMRRRPSITSPAIPEPTSSAVPGSGTSIFASPQDYCVQGPCVRLGDPVEPSLRVASSDAFTSTQMISGA